MLAWVFRPFRYLLRLLAAEHAPRQLALGLALGMLVGLVPKGNLTAIVLMGVMMSLRVNLGTGLAGAAVFSAIGVWADPLSHRVGHWLLSLKLLEPMWTSFFALPLAAWSGLNNTVVLGSLVLGLSLFYWTYSASFALFDRYSEPVINRLGQYRVARAMLRVAVAAGGNQE